MITRSVWWVLLVVPLFLECSRSDMDAVQLAVQWNLETNFAEGGGHAARFTLRNDGDVTLTPANWAMYWNMAPRTVHANSITAPVTIEWINGDFYVMRPADGFRLAPSEELEVAYTGSYAMIKESDAPLGLYSVLSGEDGSSQAYPVQDYTIAPFEGPEQIHRGEGDQEPIPTAEWLFDQHGIISELAAGDVQMIVPQPRSMTVDDGAFELGSETVIGFEEGLESEARLLGALLDGILDGAVEVRDAASVDGAAIRLQHAEVDVAGSYELRVSPDDGVSIAGDRSGVFYGTQSLVALIAPADLGGSAQSVRVPAARVTDAPAFPYRGMHLDVARNFHSVETVKRLLDVMAFYKLNKLHLHLTEDEGWRIAIEELPELTEVGGFRGHTTDDADYLQPSYGSGPFPDASIGYGSGFYSRAQYIDLLQYAWARHVEVIPEINVPGHSRAAIKAMEHRYRRLMDEGREDEAEAYRLIDPEETSQYRSAQWYTDNVISVCRESAFAFATTVIDDVVEMHAEAGVPLSMIHLGGDEVPRGAWSASPLCDEYMRDHPEVDNPRNLQKAFFRRIDEYLGAKGLQTSGWEEIAMNFREDGSWTPNDEFADGTVVPYIWNSLWGAEDLGNRLANAGYPVVLCNVTNFYFDLAYNKDPREPGLYWGGFVDTRDAFAFVPYDVFNSIEVTPEGEPYTDADFTGKARLTAEGRENVLGIQGQLWSETLKGMAMLEYYTLPKMLGLAERAWYGQADWGAIGDRAARTEATDAAWNAFANALGTREFPRLDRLHGGYNYRLAPPGARVEGGQLVANTAYPGMVVRYTTDGADPTADSPRYEGPVEVGSDLVKLSTFDSRGRASLPTVLDLR